MSSLFARAVAAVREKDKSALVSVSCTLTSPATGEKLRFAGKTEHVEGCGDYSPEGRKARLAVCPDASVSVSCTVSGADKSRESIKSTGGIVADTYHALASEVYSQSGASVPDKAPDGAPAPVNRLPGANEHKGNGKAPVKS